MIKKNKIDRKNKNRTLLWLGSGFSLGSQCISKNQPPLGRSFFSNEYVKERLPDYRILHKLYQLWERQEKPDDLEEFWVRMDKDYNKEIQMNPEEEKHFEDIFLESKEFSVNPDIKDYYDLYNSGSTASKRVLVAAGFELKCLIQDVLGKGPTERDLLEEFWHIVDRPLAILTFNYDLFVEHTLPWSYSYDNQKNNNLSEIIKLHGSVNWYHHKFCDRYGQNQFLWADNQEGLSISPQLDFKPVSAFYDSQYLHLRDPLMIGLREKREFSGEEKASTVRNFFTNLLKRSQKLLKEAECVLVIGFSFSKADDYLWDNLSYEATGNSKDFLCCHFTESNEYDEYENKVKKFFGKDGEFYKNGFNRDFLYKLKNWI